MNEHGPDSSAPEPTDELEPIDLAALFDGDLDDDDGDADDDDGADAGTDDDAALMSRIFATALADEPAAGRSTAGIVAAARSAARSAAGSVGARPGPPDQRATDELAARRRRRRFVSRGLLAAAAVAVLAVGAVAALNSRGSTGTASSDSAAVAAGSAYTAAEQTRSAAGSAAAGASGSDSSMMESSTASYSAPAAEPATPSSAGSSSSGDGETGQPPASASAAAQESRVTVTLSEGGEASPTRTGTQSAGGGCSVAGLPTAAVTAAVAVLGGRPSGQRLVAALSADACQDRALSGEVLTTADGSRVTVLVAREVGGAELTSTTADAAAQRSATVRSNQVRVLVSTPAGSSVTDRQLQQTAAAVLATQR